MNEVFVDSSAWVALADGTEPNHESAAAAYQSLLRSARLVTTNLVVAEAHTTLMRRINSRVALAFLENLLSSMRILIIHPDGVTDQEALRMLRKYADQRISFTDATSFAVMSSRSIREAFSYHKHFRIAGFNMLG